METDEQPAADATGSAPGAPAASGPAPARSPSKASLAVLAIGIGIMLALVGFIAGRRSAPAAPAKPTPTQPSEAFRGPTRLDGGVPLGYARTREGAVAAAVNFSSVLTSQRLTDRNTYLAAVRRISAPDAVEAQVKKANDYLDALDASNKLIAKAQLGFSVSIRYAPFGYQVGTYSKDDATVRVWGSTVIGLEQEPLPVEAWGTTTIKLVWTGDDWRMADQSPAASTTVPRSVQQPTPTVAGLTPELGGYEQALLYALPSRH